MIPECGCCGIQKHQGALSVLRLWHVKEEADTRKLPQSQLWKLGRPQPLAADEDRCASFVMLEGEVLGAPARGQPGSVCVHDARQQGRCVSPRSMAERGGDRSQHGQQLVETFAAAAKVLYTSFRGISLSFSPFLFFFSLVESLFFDI